MSAAADATQILRFWSEAGPDRWFEVDDAFDAEFRERFLSAHFAAAKRQCERWMQSAEGALGLLLLLDQFPRNAFRGSAHMYATDPLARHYARLALDAGLMAQVDRNLRVFFCLPFSHAESLAEQELAVTLNEQLGQPWLSHAIGHREVVRRFGRFPHRNAMLGRETTAEEQAFLDGGGFAG